MSAQRDTVRHTHVPLRDIKCVVCVAAAALRHLPGDMFIPASEFADELQHAVAYIYKVDSKYDPARSTTGSFASHAKYELHYYYVHGDLAKRRLRESTDPAEQAQPLDDLEPFEGRKAADALDDAIFRVDMERQLTRRQKEIYVRRRAGYLLSEIADEMELSAAAMQSECRRIQKIYRES